MKYGGSSTEPCQHLSNTDKVRQSMHIVKCIVIASLELDTNLQQTWLRLRKNPGRADFLGRSGRWTRTLHL